MRIDIWDKSEYSYRASYGFMPNIRTFVHEDDEKRTSFLVIPGGGYCVVTPHEGELIAKKFYDLGFNTFVLTYTTDITMSVPLKKQPLYDAARAVRLIRNMYPESKLVVCGFSAGGHVAGSLITHYDEISDEKYPDISARPDAAVFGYSVITTGEFTHHWSIVALLGDDATEDELNYFSVEKNIKSDTPPCFIWQTATDDLVPVENSYLLARALKEKGVKFAHYVFPEGHHGLSLPNDDFFTGKAGGEYTMEQVNLAIENVRKGTTVDVSEERRAELIAQFDAPPMSFEGIEIPSFKDILMWPDLAVDFLGRVLD